MDPNPITTMSFNREAPFEKFNAEAMDVFGHLFNVCRGDECIVLMKVCKSWNEVMVEYKKRPLICLASTCRLMKNYFFVNSLTFESNSMDLFDVNVTTIVSLPEIEREITSIINYLSTILTRLNEDQMHELEKIMG